MTPRELEAARALVTRWTSEGGATASSDWLYRTEEDSLVELIAEALATAHARGRAEGLEAAAQVAERDYRIFQAIRALGGGGEGT